MGRTLALVLGSILVTVVAMVGSGSLFGPGTAWMAPAAKAWASGGLVGALVLGHGVLPLMVARRWIRGRRGYGMKTAAVAFTGGVVLAWNVLALGVVAGAAGPVRRAGVLENWRWLPRTLAGYQHALFPAEEDRARDALRLVVRGYAAAGVRATGCVEPAVPHLTSSSAAKAVCLVDVVSNGSIAEGLGAALALELDRTPGAKERGEAMIRRYNEAQQRFEQRRIEVFKRHGLDPRPINLNDAAGRLGDKAREVLVELAPDCDELFDTLEMEGPFGSKLSRGDRLIKADFLTDRAMDVARLTRVDGTRFRIAYDTPQDGAPVIGPKGAVKEAGTWRIEW